MDGITLEELRVVIEAQTSQFKKEIAAVQSQLKSMTSNVSKETNKMKSAFSGIGKAAVAALAVTAVLAVGRFGASCIELGSALTEVQNVVDVTFGSMSGQVNDFADTAITQFGLSEKSAKQYSSTMGAMLKSMQIPTGQALEMSTTLAGLSGDMASFYNLSGDNAFDKIRAGITGETEPLKQLGINMSVANLEAYAMRQGITKAYSAMNQQEQTMLRYNYLLSVTSDAQGDFARTSSSWANQTRILSEQFNSLKATIGQGLINVLAPVITLLNSLMSKLQGVASAFEAFTALITGKQASSSASGSIASAIAATDSLADSTASVGTAAAATAAQVKKSLAGFDQINQLSDNSSSSGGGTSGTSGSSGTGSTATGGATIDESSSVSAALADFVKKIQPTIDAFKNLWNAVKPLAAAIGEGFVTFCKRVAKIGLNIIPPIINGIADALKGIDPDAVEAVSIALLEVATAIAAIKITKSVITRLNELSTSLSLLSTNQKIAISVTVAVAAIEFAHIKWAEVFKDSDYQEVHDALFNMFSDAFGNNMVGDAFAASNADIFTGLGALFSGAYTPKEWIDGFYAWGEDCKKSFDKGYHSFDIDVSGGIEADLDTLTLPFRKWWEDTVKDVGGIKVYWATKWDDLKGYWKALTDNITKPDNSFKVKLLSKWGDIKSDWYALVDNIKNSSNGFSVRLSSTWANIRQDWNNLISNIKNDSVGFDVRIATAWSKLKSTWDALKANITDHTVDFKLKISTASADIKNYVNDIIDEINTHVISKLNIKLQIPSYMPVIGGKTWSWSAPEIKRLARGGIVDGATPFIAGEAGKEAVIPLENNTGWMDSVADRLASRISSGSGITESSMYNVMSKVFKEYMRLSFYIGDEDIANHANRGNTSLGRRYSPVNA